MSSSPVLPCPVNSFSYEDPSVYYDSADGMLRTMQLMAMMAQGGWH